MSMYVSYLLNAQFCIFDYIVSYYIDIILQSVIKTKPGWHQGREFPALPSNILKPQVVCMRSCCFTSFSSSRFPSLLHFFVCTGFLSWLWSIFTSLGCVRTTPSERCKPAAWLSLGRGEEVIRMQPAGSICLFPPSSRLVRER